MRETEYKLDEAYLAAVNDGLPFDEAQQKAIDELGQDEAQYVRAPDDAAGGLGSAGMLQRSKRMLGDARRVLSSADLSGILCAEVG